MNRKCMSKKVITLVIVAAMLNSGLAVHAADKDNAKKDEAVYVTLDSNGIIKEKIVSDWLHSDKTNVKIEDKSSLTQIKNIKGEEHPEISGENLTWKSDKSDIYYQGKTNKKLPLNVNIEYELDGKKIKAKDLAGKSGNVKIKIKFKNLDAHTVKVKGKDKTVYTPFTVGGVVDLPTDKFKNIKVSDGELISDGKNQMVAFASLPGLKDSLNISKDLIDLDLKDEIEITADAKDFELTPIMITATPKLPEMDKIEKSDTIDELKDGIKELKDNSLKLVDGSEKLASGCSEFSGKSKELVSNVSLLNSKMGELSSGISLFNNKALNPMKSGSKDLESGIMQYTAGVGVAKKGAVTLSDGLKKAGPGANKLGEGMSTYAEKATAFSQGSKKISDGINDLSSKADGLKKKADGFKSKSQKMVKGAQTISNGSKGITDGLNKAVNSTDKLSGGSQDVSQGLQKSIDSLRKLEEAKARESEGMQQTINSIAGLQQVINPLKNIAGAESIFGKLSGGFEQLKQKTIEGKQGSDTILAKLQELEGGLTGIKEGADRLSGGINELQQGQKQLIDSSVKLSQGADGFSKEVSSGIGSAIKDLEKDTAILPGKLKELNEGNKKLTDGSKGLQAGSSQIVGGTKQFNSQLKSAVDGSKQISDGLCQLDGKSPDLRGGASKLSKGATEASRQYSQINSGASQLANGTNLLNDATSILPSAVGQLSKGASDLKDGMKKFNDEGINKLDSKVSDGVTDVEEIMDTKDEIVNLSKDYETFTGVGDNMEGEVKFVLKTDEIKKPKVENKKKDFSNKENKEKEEGGFVNWIKNIFN